MKIEEKNEKLVITDFSETEAYKIASKIEKDGIRFYKKIASNVKDADVKKSLEYLVEEEVKHLKFFEGCLFDIRGQKEEDNDDDDLLNSMDFGVFEPYQSIRELENVISDEKKAIRLGIVIEEKSIIFYNACLYDIFSAAAKKELANIIEEEKRHKSILEGIMKK